MTQAYPLHWPLGARRTASPHGSQFKTSLPQALRNVQDELRRFGKDTGCPVSAVVISSNVTLGAERPADPGIAVYFRWDGMDACIAVDKYTRVECNLQAIAKVIEAERAKARHGGLNIVRATFRGFTALPPPKGPDGQLAAPWWVVLGLPSAREPLSAAEDAYRRLVKETHPDRAGGDAGRFAAVADAIREARQVASA